MSQFTSRDGDLYDVDRDYAGHVGEDVRVHIAGAMEEDVRLILTPGEAREFARFLNHHADEVDEINKENDRA